MKAEEHCNKPFPLEDDVHCRREKRHSGNHSAEAEIVDKNKEKWDKAHWEWDDSGLIVQQPAKHSSLKADYPVDHLGTILDNRVRSSGGMGRAQLGQNAPCMRMHKTYNCRCMAIPAADDCTR